MSETSSGKPVKNCFECSGVEMSSCPLFYVTKNKSMCSNRIVCDNDWIKYLNGDKKFTTYTKMLDELIKKHDLEEIPIVNVGKSVDLSEMILQNVVQTVSDVSGDDLHNSRLILLTYGDFKHEIDLARNLGYRGPIAIFSDDSLAKKYGKRLGADEICQTKEDIYKVILKYIA